MEYQSSKELCTAGQVTAPCDKRMTVGPANLRSPRRIRSIQVTTTDFKTQLRTLIQLQRTAHTKDGVPDAATRRDRLTRAATMLAGASDAIAVAMSEDFGHR